MDNKPTYDELVIAVRGYGEECKALKAHVERLRGEIIRNTTVCVSNGVAFGHEWARLAWNATPAQSLNHIKAQVEEETIEQFNSLRIWPWLSAALDDDSVCAQMKLDVVEAFTFLEQRKYATQLEAGTLPTAKDGE